MTYIYKPKMSPIVDHFPLWNSQIRWAMAGGSVVRKSIKIHYIALTRECRCIYIYICTYIHTYIHTHIYIYIPQTFF